MSIKNGVQKYHFGKGRIVVFERDAFGNVGQGFYVGNCPEFKISNSTEKITHSESMSGKNRQDVDLVKSVSSEVSLVLESLDKKNAGLLVWGTDVTISGVTAEEYEFPTVEVGGIYSIPNGINITDIEIVDSHTPSANTLVEGTHYEIEPKFGTVQIKSLSGVTQPIKATFDTEDVTAIPFFTENRKYRFIRFEGINLNDNSNVVVEIYKTAFDPSTDISLIGDDLAKFELKGAALVDDTRDTDPNLGGFGRIIQF